MLGDAAGGRHPAVPGCRIVGYGAEVSDEKRGRLFCGSHASGAGVVVEGLFDALGFTASHRLAEPHRLRSCPSCGFDVTRQFIQLALQVVDPSGERLDLPLRARDLGSVVTSVERPVVLGERSCRIGETGSGMPDLVAQCLLALGEVSNCSVVVAESPTDPLGR